MAYPEAAAGLMGLALYGDITCQDIDYVATCC